MSLLCFLSLSYLPSALLSPPTPPPCGWCEQDLKVFDVWFRVDARPFKQALLNIVKRWSFLFKQYLIDHVTNSLKDLSEFITVKREMEKALAYIIIAA